MQQDIIVSAGWITAEEAEELTGYNPDHLRRLARSGKVPARKLAGRVWLFARDALLEWQATARRGPKKKPQA